MGASLVVAATTTCSATKKCPEDSPCCSRESYFLYQFCVFFLSFSFIYIT